MPAPKFTPTTQPKKPQKPSINLVWSRRKKHIQDKPVERCPYCSSKDIVKRGWRRKKHEAVQLHKCKNCDRTFTAQIVKGKHHPLKIIFEGITLYNLGYTEAQACRLLKDKYGLQIKQPTVSTWITEFLPLCRYSRLRPEAVKHYSPKQVIQSVTLRHKQIYHYRYHQAKLDFLINSREFAKFKNLKTLLESVKKDCPHALFQKGERSSQAKAEIDLHEVQVNHIENNYATRLARLLLQAVGDNKLRHDALQQFMLANDSVTIAMEVPIHLKPSDLEHYAEKLRFQIPFKLKSTLTGHIDLLQLRNGSIHILDFKPNAAKVTMTT